jgi:hypothetical protein
MHEFKTSDVRPCQLMCILRWLREGQGREWRGRMCSFGATVRASEKTHVYDNAYGRIQPQALGRRGT